MTTSQNSPQTLSKTTKKSFGVDIGGTGIKGALVNLETGELLSERFRVATPQPATPEAVADTVQEILDMAQWDGPVGITIPAVVQHQKVMSAAHIDPSWIEIDAQELFHATLGNSRDITVVNDADAAGIAEKIFGAAQDETGAVLALTLGTGIGSALFYGETLIPNTEFGHMPYKGPKKTAEDFASNKVRETKDLSWKKWGKRVNKILKKYDTLTTPDLIVIGGGVSKHAHKWFKYLNLKTPVKAAALRNNAGIVGAAVIQNVGITP